MVAIYGSAVWAYISVLIAYRGFYAIGDRIAPVRENLALAKRDAGDAEMWEALEAAHAAAFVRALPKMLTAGPREASVSKPSTNSPMMRSTRHASVVVSGRATA